MKAVIMESLGIPEQELAQLEAPFEEKGVVFEHFDRTSDTKTLIAEAKDADAMILANMPMPEEVIRSCPALKFIDIAFTGVDHVGLGAAKERGIAVSNASGYSSEAVSELVLGMVLAKARNIRAVEDRCRTGGTKDGLVGWEIMGKTVGIIGLGKIGSRTAQLFHAFGATILASSRSYHKDAPDYVTQVDQDELLRRSDIVVLHCPLNDSTRGMIGAKQLTEMKPMAILVNAARGPVVNEKDLAAALEDGVIAGACLDVFDKEPPLAEDTEILKAPNTLVTPHVAFATKESMTLRARIVFDNLKAWMDGQPINVIL
ncbi:MAG: hydroxyacid dehydrogenase [Lachnospiraceae bacterium]|jgi:D-3-phosphoglycerate dehydrogenase|nr:hydroxyacid dehydrogenase [Lachnospiraceae bacterium]MCH4071040.1 hydroxyacid dehydrogenase [Lachnospiraceae bacterium]MCH4108111.1 hydroxyacid dehydrogenase [Lachnospiraceae bacterium]MCI1331918.1 hydroxyacid dehydrogenase [Lachnospiraceae bacterium]MCI1360674.1 hydroxyacid dehydrogenase [Lachnospiraceae bacterium]